MIIKEKKEARTKTNGSFFLFGYGGKKSGFFLSVWRQDRGGAGREVAGGRSEVGPGGGEGGGWFLKSSLLSYSSPSSAVKLFRSLKWVFFSRRLE